MNLVLRSVRYIFKKIYRRDRREPLRLNLLKT